MSSGAPPPDLGARVRVMQVITVGITGGAVIFLGIALRLRGQGSFDPPVGPPVLTYTGLGMIAAELVPYFLVPHRMAASWRRRVRQATAGAVPSVTALDAAPLYQTALIIRLALIEGVTFTFILAYMMEASQLGLALAVGLILLLVLHFPTRGRLESWTAAQKERMYQEQ